jgi:flagellar basal-body rod protein FlgB
MQDSLDGNTVDEQIEQSQFMENAVQYQASLDFLGGKFNGIRKALKGE